jgi:hypothetical protein
VEEELKRCSMLSFSLHVHFCKFFIKFVFKQFHVAKLKRFFVSAQIPFKQVPSGKIKEQIAFHVCERLK